MKHLTVIKIALFLLVCNNVFSQERVNYNKDTIYLNFDKNSKFKLTKSDDIEFNISGKEVLLFKKEVKPDTLCLLHLKEYKIVSIEGVNNKIKYFERSTHKKKPLKDSDKLYQFYHKNDIFITYLIKVLKGKNRFIIYPVIWKNQGEMEINTRFEPNKN